MTTVSTVEGRNRKSMGVIALQVLTTLSLMPHIHHRLHFPPCSFNRQVQRVPADVTEFREQRFAAVFKSDGGSHFVPQCEALSQSGARKPLACFTASAAVASAVETRFRRWHAHFWCCGSWYARPLLPTKIAYTSWYLTLWVTFTSWSAIHDGVSLHLLVLWKKVFTRRLPLPVVVVVVVVLV